MKASLAFLEKWEQLCKQDATLHALSSGPVLRTWVFFFGRGSTVLRAHPVFRGRSNDAGASTKLGRLSNFLW